MRRSIFFYSKAVWPSAVLVWLFIISYGLVAISLWLIELPLHGAGGTITDTPEIQGIRSAILEGAAALFAMFRLFRFHPVCNQAYTTWLKSTPWTANRPLPLGPVHPVLQDAVVIGVLTVIAVWHAHISAALPVGVFIFFYLAGLTLVLAFARRWWSCLALGFLWPALLLPDAVGLPSILLVVAITLVVWHGHRQCLKTFPWDFLGVMNRPTGSIIQTQIRIDINNQSSSGTQAGLGWPYMALSPKIRPASVSHVTSICLSTLFGWWSFCFVEYTRPDPLPELLMFFSIFAAFLRFGIYLNGMTPPFSLWSRIVWGRILVPGFDKIFLTPLLAVVVGVLGGMLIKHSGDWVPVTESCVFALIWYVLFAGGPALRNWILTGQHGFRSPARVNTNKQLLRPV